MKQFGSLYYGSREVKNSEANEEIIPKGVHLYKFSIYVSDNCTVSINGSEPIFIPGGTGFSSEQNDAMIYSFKILEDGIDYHWIGGA